MSRLKLPVLIALLCAAGALPIFAWQLPAAGPATGIIVGQVVDADTGRGVPSAIVRIGPRLQTMGPSGQWEDNLTAYSSNMRYIAADAQGRFVIRGISPGNYSLVLSAPGYLPSSYGQQRLNGPLRELTIAADQRVANVVIKGWRRSVLTGTVYDETGAPAVMVPVRALRVKYLGGRRIYSAVGRGRSDDRGEYRITGLEPGDYVAQMPSSTTTIAADTYNTYVRESAAGNRAVAGAIERDASVLGIALSASSVPIGTTHMMLAGIRLQGLPAPVGSAGTMIYPHAFHPAASDFPDATVIRLRPGEERTGVDLHLKVVPAFYVSGIVSGPDGPVSGIGLQLVSGTMPLFAEAGGMETATTVAGADGRFLFAGVPAGQYTIKALRIPPAGAQGMTATSFNVGGGTANVTSVTPSGGAAPAPAAPTLWTQTPIAVGGNLDNVQVLVSHGMRVSGRYEFEGATPPPTLDRLVGPVLGAQLAPADGRAAGAFTPARPTPDMRFSTMQYPPGRYYVSVTPPPGWFLKSAMVKGTDALRTPFTLEKEDVSDVVVTFTDRVTELSGTVRAVAGSAPGDWIVVAFPADYRAWIDSGMTPRLLRSASASPTGTFALRDFLPGEYLAAAYPASAPRVPQDPALIIELAALATRVSIGAGEKATVALSGLPIK
jgi:hypothetical protein